MPNLRISHRLWLWLLLAIPAFAIAIPRQTSAQDDLPPSAIILDPDITFYSWPYPRISPDGKWVAYVSKGFVCVCNATAPKPRQIMEVPHSYTWPHFKIGDGSIAQEGTFAELSRSRGRDEYRNLHAQVTHTIHGLDWTNDSKGFVFGVQSYDAAVKKSTYDCYYASISDALTELVHIVSDPQPRGIAAGILTEDRKLLVSGGMAGASERYRPLIWDVKENRPRATPFLNLVPSPTSGRWIAIEKDTRQLVITDENFDVVKRFEEFCPSRSFGFKLDWSPNERFAILRNQIGFDHYSNWEGFWIDLQSGLKRELEGNYMDEQFTFTGNGGEFFRAGTTGEKSKHISGNVSTGTHITMLPGDASSPPKDIWIYELNRDAKRPGAFTNDPTGFLPVHFDPTSNLFTVRLVRPTGEKPSWVWHLMDRDGNKWPLPGRDNGAYASPYDIIGFADSGKCVIAYNKKQLFSISIAAIKDPAKN